MIAILCTILFIFYVILNLALIAQRNYKAHQFFKTKSPNLPVVPNPSIFSGHIYSITSQQKNWKIITDLHEKYGTTFGFYIADQAWVSTKDIDLLKLIEIDEAHKHVNRCKFGLPFKEFNDSIFQVDDEKWRRVRRAISPALTNHKVRSEEVSGDIEYILSQLSDAIEFKISEAEKKSGARSVILHVDDTFRRFTLAVIFLVTYKKDKMINFYSEVDEWAKIMQDGARNITNPLVTLAIMFPFIRPLARFLIQFDPVGQLQVKILDYIIRATDINRFAREIHQKYQRKLSMEANYKERKFSELKQSGQFKRRLVDTIIDAFLEKRMKYDEFLGSTFFLLLAGFETTSATITCLIWHLAHQPEIQEKLRKTIKEEGIDADYVVWCIMETIRWHPAVPLGTGRILTRDIDVNGCFVPKGSFVMPSTYSIHHDDSIWPEADKFKPERWRDSANFHPAAFMGFGLGPRNCVGGKMAIHEIKLVMRLLLMKYRIEKSAETVESYDFSSPGLIYTILDRPIKVRLVEL